MQLFNTAAGAIDGYNKSLGEAVSAAFRTLLEQKHLYQSVVIDDDATRRAFLPGVEARIKEHLTQGGKLSYGSSHLQWIVPNEGMAVASPEGRPVIFITLEHAKLYCRTCDRIEAFNLESARSSFEAHKYRPAAGKFEQVYVLCYQCQSCKGLPEVFIVRRNQGKLTLCGRSPIEHVAVSPEIPKEVAAFYSGAVVAYQSGQTLAALFLLRTLCEQWARKFADPSDYADVAIDKYLASLPDAFKSHFPSLRSIYERLSADIHAAIGSRELYEQMIVEINEHFSARKVFKLPNP